VPVAVSWPRERRLSRQANGLGKGKGRADESLIIWVEPLPEEVSWQSGS
jgi:hypothetical protein